MKSVRKMTKQLKYKLYDILEEPTGLDTKIINLFLTLLIGLNGIAVILETVETIYNQYQVQFAYFELFSIAIFTLEYLLRVWVCNINPRYSGTMKGRIRYLTSSSAMIDLFSFLPFYLPILFPDLRLIRILRFFRIFRLFKLGRYSKSIRILYRTFRAKKEALIVTFMMAFMILIFAAGIMYYVEHEVQPEVFPDIPSAMWYAVVTLTTVGYGDAYPKTGVGKLFGALIAFVGIGLFALPTGILASGFSDEISKERKKECCPHCGKEL